MGLIMSKLKRTKRTVDILERLADDIKSMERDRHSKRQTLKRFVVKIEMFAFFLFLLFIILFYCLYEVYNHKWELALVFASPCFFLACILVSVRSFISCYYKWHLNESSIKLMEMKKEKKRLLDDVMENETYKVAKPILDRYGIPEQDMNIEPSTNAFAAHSGESSTTENYALTSVDVK